jgi:hypothetical protein
VGSDAGQRRGSDHALKVETRVRTPLGLRTENRRSTALLPTLMGRKRGDWRRPIPQISPSARCKALTHTPLLAITVQPPD